jgi:ketosteroid isomerase-like protein
MTDLLHELNRDIWHPFVASYGALDAPAFLALHTPDFIRAGGPTREILGFAEYAAQTEKFFADVAGRGDALGVDFRFTERIAAGQLASERGVFQISVTLAAGGQRQLYARFHTFARKIDERWRLAVDYDTTDGGTVDAASFAAGVEITDVAAFAG